MPVFSRVNPFHFECRLASSRTQTLRNIKPEICMGYTSIQGFSHHLERYSQYNSIIRNAGRVLIISFEGRLIFLGAPYSLNTKPQIWNTMCKAAPWMIFSLQLYYSKFPVIGRVNTIRFKGRHVFPSTPSSSKKPLKYGESRENEYTWSFKVRGC